GQSRAEARGTVARMVLAHRRHTPPARRACVSLVDNRQYTSLHLIDVVPTARAAAAAAPARGHPGEAGLGEGRFAGKVAIVSGGSHGIGRAIAAGFLGEGGSVVIADLVPPDFFAGDPRVAGVTGDIAEPGFAERVLRAAVSRFGAADILVNDAAAYPDGTLLDMPATAWDRVFAVNVTGTFM